MAFLFEQTHFRELEKKLPVVFGDLGNRVVFEVVAIEEFIEVLPGCGWMVSYKGIGDVLAGKIEEGEVAAGVGFDPIGDVVDFALD